MGLTPGQPLVPGQVPTAVAATTPYLAGVPQVGSTFSPYFSPGPIMPLTVGPDPTAPLSMAVQQTAVVTQQKMPRTDRLEGGSGGFSQRKRAHESADELLLVSTRFAQAVPEAPRPQSVTDSSHILYQPMDMKSVGSFYYENFWPVMQGFPGMVPYKRAAGEKSGVPVYQPSATYQQLLQPFVPVSFTGHPPGVPRF